MLKVFSLLLALSSFSSFCSENVKQEKDLKREIAQKSILNVEKTVKQLKQKKEMAYQKQKVRNLGTKSI